MEGDQDSFGLVLFFVFLRFDSGLFFCPGENAIPVCGELPGEIFKGAEFTDRFGSAFSLVVDVGHSDIKRFRILGFRSSHFHGKPSSNLSYHRLPNIAIE